MKKIELKIINYLNKKHYDFKYYSFEFIIFKKI